MLKIVSRASGSGNKPERQLSSKNGNLKVAKTSPGPFVNLNARYWDLCNEYIHANDMLIAKTDAKIRAHKEYLEAKERVKKISYKIKILEVHVTKI